MSGKGAPTVEQDIGLVTIKLARTQDSRETIRVIDKKLTCIAAIRMKQRHLLTVIWVNMFAAILVNPCPPLHAQNGIETRESSDRAISKEGSPQANAKLLKTTVKKAFHLVHDGWSSDEVILDDELYRAFIAKCKELFPESESTEFGWTLLNLRKAGQLETKSTRRKQSNVSPVAHIAEIAARSTTDRFRVSIDRVMVDPEKRAAFDSAAIAIDTNVDLYHVRKAAFMLRKARRLQPELITRIADWNRVVETHALAIIADKPELIPERPGIYIFRDQTGYLYIGQTENLRARLSTHLDQSHSRSLSEYLAGQGSKNISIEIHSFDPSSRAKEVMVRRAYESELISSRKPRFNIQP